MKKLFKLSPFKLSVLITVAGIVAYMAGIPFLDLMELKTLDLRFRSRDKAPASQQVVLAVIDEKSINTEGKWVWPRSKMAKLINKLSGAGARVTAFDIGFLEPDDQRVVNAISTIQTDIGQFKLNDNRLQAYLEELKLRSDEDRLLAGAIESSQSKVVLGYFFHMGQSDLSHVDEKTIEIHQENIAPRRLQVRTLCQPGSSATPHDKSRPAAIKYYPDRHRHTLCRLFQYVSGPRWGCALDPGRHQVPRSAFCPAFHDGGKRLPG